MHRIFGKSKPKEAAPTLDQTNESLEKRGGEIDDKVKKLDDELLRYKQQLSKMKPGPAKNQLQQRALRVLKQKKMYDKQRDTIYNQQFNVDQTRFATQNVKDTISTVSAMKAAHGELKSTMKNIKLNEIEDMHDDMHDILEDAAELDEIMGRSYAINEDVTEDDLLAELEGMEELEAEAESEEMPAYLLNAATATKQHEQATVTNNNNQQENKHNEIEVDEFGLPKVPVRNLS